MQFDHLFDYFRLFWGHPMISISWPFLPGVANQGLWWSRRLTFLVNLRWIFWYSRWILGDFYQMDELCIIISYKFYFICTLFQLKTSVYFYPFCQTFLFLSFLFSMDLSMISNGSVHVGFPSIYCHWSTHWSTLLHLLLLVD